MTKFIKLTDDTGYRLLIPVDNIAFVQVAPNGFTTVVLRSTTLRRCGAIKVRELIQDVEAMLL